MDQSPCLRWRMDGEPIHPEAPGQRRRRIRGRGGEEEERGGGREVMASAAGREVGEGAEIELLAGGM